MPLSESPEYEAFLNAKYRCTNPDHPRWNDYGGRGIEFRFTSFNQFLEEVGTRPEGMTLDRINNNGHYEPGNVRWATRIEQQSNRRKQCMRTITFERRVEFKVDAAEAARLRREGLTLREIKARLGTDASIPTISRSIRRADAAPSID